MKNNLTYFLGTHQPSWLPKTKVPLFVSFNRLTRYKKLPKSLGTWALDSGAFSELFRHGKWRLAPAEYAEGVRKLDKQIGKLKWASIQDWLCTPAVLRQTGLSLKVHQRRTVENLYILRKIAPEIRWLPILQGWSSQSYLDHLGMYKAKGFDLRQEPLVGVGSIAVRQTSEILLDVLHRLHDDGLAIHAFGLSISGLMQVCRLIASSDSMVWSFTARRRQLKHQGCKENHDVCNNCLAYALAWRRNLLSRIH